MQHLEIPTLYPDLTSTKLPTLSITIENPTAEPIIHAIQQLPPVGIQRLQSMLSHPNLLAVSSEWNEQDKQELDLATCLLIEKRFGPEECDYD